jgi:hypothetical protein
VIRTFPSIAATLGLLSAIATAASALTPGFEADFESNLYGFGGGSTVANPATGGVGDSGYMAVSNAFENQLGARTEDADLTGDYTTAGVTGIRFWLNDTGADDALELHVAIGRAFGNVWQYDTGFDPPNGSWAEYQVPLNDGTGWTRIIGSGTFADAKATSDRLLIRHDLSPYTQFPETITADFGVDSITLEPVTIPIPAVGGSGLGALALAVIAAAGLLLRRRVARA